METTLSSDSKRMYSWWWDSHICPKNSKWLQENLTDMDTKIKQMIKLIEEDADSFARRAEMYYEKRPELMKLVEGFYRAYRALAERYDQATGVLRQAHRTMAEVFPNQVPLVLPDDSPAPKLSSPYVEESDSVAVRKGMQQLNEPIPEAKARKVLNFNDQEEDLRNQTEIDILSLKQGLSKLEAEKESGLLQFQISLERWSNLESEVSRAREDSRSLNERANKAEADVQALKETLLKLEADQEISVLHYQQCLDKISTLERNILHVQKHSGDLTERACKAEAEVESLKLVIVRVEAEKEAATFQCRHSLDIISNLADKVLNAEENARRCKDRADRAEGEVVNLKQAFFPRLSEEKETATLQYKQCSEKVASLERQISAAQEEIDYGADKLKGMEERCVELERVNETLRSDLESLVEKIGSQCQELMEKKKETGRLWTCVQEERLRFSEVEAAFRTLQTLHSQSLEELRSMAAEIQNRDQNSKDLETRSQCLKDESTSLRETIGKLEAEVEIRVNERNTDREEIYCLKEQLCDMKTKNRALSEQVESVGFDPECFGSSVKELQNEISKLRMISEMDRREKEALMEKRAEVELLENEADELFVKLNAASVREAVFEGKMDEMTETCVNLEDESSLKDMKIEMLEEKASYLGSENGELRTQLAMYISSIISLKESIATLEDYTLLNKKAHSDDKHEAKTSVLAKNLQSDNSPQKNGDVSVFSLDRSFELHDLQRRVQAIKMAVAETKRFEMMERLTECTKQETVKKEIEAVDSRNVLERAKSGSYMSRQNGQERERKPVNWLQRPKSEISEAWSDVLTKDIILDHISKSSSSGIGRREAMEADNHMLELWESTNNDGSINLMVSSKATASSADYHLGEHESEHLSIDSLIEKELGVDKLEISKRFSELHKEGNKRKIIERLDSDAQKLTNLQITIEDLKRKVEATEKSKIAQNVEYDTALGQLEEAEAMIVKLFEGNSKLMKNVKGLASDGVAVTKSNDSGSVRKRRIAEQARRGSEKIGRLQLEVQRLQFLLLKLDDEKVSRGKTRIIEKKTKVLLKDYLYGGGTRTTHNRKKSAFCGCMQVPTKSDRSK